MMNFKSYFLLFISILSFSFLSYSKDIYVNDASTTGDVWCTAAGSAGGTGTKAAPFSTLKAALASSTATLSNPDVIYVDAGNYFEKSLIAKSYISVIGAGAYKTTFSSSGSFLIWFMKIVGVQKFSISNLTINGYLNSQSSEGENFTIQGSSDITIENVTFGTNRSSAGECAIFIGDNSLNILIDGSSASCQNTANGAGGIRIKGNKISVKLYNSLLAGNDNSSQGATGSALQIISTSTPSDLSVDVQNCIFSKNTSKSGGAIHIQGGSVTINKCKFLNNKSTNLSGESGGAIWIAKTSSLCTISNSEFKDNTAIGDGGAIQIYTSFSGPGNADVKIENCQFENNMAVNGNDIHTRMKSDKFFNLLVNKCIFKNLSSSYVNIYSGPAPNSPCQDGVFDLKNSGAPNVLSPTSPTYFCPSVVNNDNLPSGYTDSGISFPTYQETCPNATICKPAVPGTAPTVTCPPKTATLTVTGPSNSTFTWYSDSVPTGGTVIGNTSNISPAIPDFTTPTISATKKFYVVSSLDNCQTRVPITVTYDCPTCTSTITYAGSPFCQKDKVTPTLTPTPSGSVIYSCTAADAPNATTDLIINSSTGEIDLANSKPGKYTIQCEVSASCKPKTVITINPKPTAPLFTITSQPNCNDNGFAQVNPFLVAPAVYTFKPSNGISIDGTGKITAASGKYKFVVTKDGCTSDSSALLEMNPVPGKPVLEGPSSVCVGSEITLKAWTDNTKNTKSTPNGTTPWKVKDDPKDLDTVSLTTGTDPSLTSNIIKGLKAVSPLKPGEATIVYSDNSGCTAEHTVKVNPLPVVPVKALSYVPSNPLVFAGNEADTVCKGKNAEFSLTGTVGDSVFFKGKNGPFRYKILTSSDLFTINNLLRDTTIVIDSISNNSCSSKFTGLSSKTLKITMADTAFSLKAFSKSKCDLDDGKIEVTLSTVGKLSWTSTNLTPVIDGSDNISSLPTNSIYTIPSKPTQTKLKKGNYTVNYYNGGCLLSKSTTISDPNAPYLEADPISSPLSICAGDSIVLKAWTDNTKGTKSTPNSIQAWLPDNLNVTLKDTVNLTSTPPTTLQRVIANTGGTSVITYTDINGCKADITVSIKTAGIPTTINNATDLVQSFCAADINKVSNLKPTGLNWFDEKGTVELAPTTVLKTQFYYAAIKDASNGCFTKKSDRIKVEVKINANPNEPAVSTTQPFCKVDNPEVADLLPAPSNDIKWFLKSGSNLTPQVPLDKLIKDKYLVKKMENGCLSINGVEVDVDVISVPKPKAPNQKLCANNEKPLTLGGLYSSDITNYYFYDLFNVSLFPSQPVANNEQYKVKQSLNGCLSEDTTITIKILDGTSLATSKYILTPAFCKVDGPTLAAIEAKYSALPTSGSIYWYDAQNSSLTNDLPKSSVLGGTAYSYWIAVKDADGCFSKKQEVVFTIDAGKKPDLKPIELCKTSDYTLTNLDVANISNPKGTLTWYLSQTGVGLAPTTVPKNSTQEYWASYKETTASCEGERVKLAISSWLDLSQTFTLNETNQKFCKTANKTVDDLDPAPFTDAKIAWFETTTTTTPYIDTDPLTEKIYYAAEYKITSVGDYCVNPNRVPVNVSLYSNKIYPIVKESVCSKQNGSIEFINPPAGVTFEWYEQADPTTLDFTGAKYNKPLEKQSFKIKIKDVSGCEEEVSVALPECTDSPIPQILSPNNDEFNNKWVINYSGKYKNVQVRIFNRWGNEVYTSSIPYKDDWDGKRNNEYLPSGTYYYVIDKGNGEPIESGYIELIK